LKFQTIKNQPHYVYDSVAEFEAFKSVTGIVPKIVENWRDGEEGQWVVADDGGVVQLLKVSNSLKHPHDGNYKYSQGWCRTVVGSFRISEKEYMDTDFKQHANRYVFSRTLKNANDNFKKRKDLTKQEYEFCLYVKLGKAIHQAASLAYNIKDEDKARVKAFLLLKQPRIMSEIKQAVKEVLENRGIDHATIIDGWVDLWKNGVLENTKLMALGKLTKIVGTEEKEEPNGGQGSFPLPNGTPVLGAVFDANQLSAAMGAPKPVKSMEIPQEAEDISDISTPIAKVNPEVVQD